MFRNPLARWRGREPARGGFNLDGVQQLDARLDILDDVLSGFNGPTFSAKAQGSFGELSLALNHDVSTGNERLIFVWYPSGSGKSGKNLRIEHELTEDRISLAVGEVTIEPQADVWGRAVKRRFFEGFDWFTEGDKPDVAARYRLLMRMLIPKMGYAGVSPEYLQFVREQFNGGEEKVDGFLSEAGLPGARQLLEDLKARALARIFGPGDKPNLPRLMGGETA